MNDNGKTKVILSIIGLASVLLVTIGVTYTYFSARVSGEDESIVEIHSASEGTVVDSMGVETNVVLTTEGIYPSDTAWLTKEVSIYSVGTTKAEGQFNFNLVVESNTFENDDIRYLLTLVDNSNTNGNTPVTITSIDIPSSTKHSIAKTSSIQTYPNIVTATVAKNIVFNVTFKFELYFISNPNVNQNYADQRELECYLTAHYFDGGEENSLFKMN